MGIIQRQGLKRSIVSYSAAVIGAFGILVIYPLAFGDYGQLRFIVAVTMFIYPLVSLGISGLAVRFFPEFNASGKDRGLLMTLLGGFTVLYGLFALVMYFYLPLLSDVLKALNWNTEMFTNNAPTIGVLVFFVGLVEILKRYVTNFGRVVVPEIISNAGLKFAMPILVLGLFWGYFKLPTAKWLLVALFASMACLLIYYLRRLGGWTLSFERDFFTNKRVKSMVAYSAYGVLGSVGSVMAFQIDSLMVAGLVTNAEFESGQYFNALNMASFVSVPQGAISAIAGPIISTAIYHKKWGQVKDIYRQSSLNLLIVGTLVYLMIVVNLVDIFTISTNTAGMLPLFWPVIILGGAKVIDMASGMNREIMGYSNLYLSNLAIVMLLAVVNIIANYVLIPIYGLTGAAIATFSSLLLINAIRFIFLWIKKGIQPFSWSHLELLAVALIVASLAMLLPRMPWLLATIGLRCLFVTGLILYANHVRGWSALLNDFLKKYIKLAKNFLQRN